MADINDARTAFRAEIGRDRPNRRKDTANAVWVFKQWPVPNTTRQEALGTFLTETRIAAVQAVRAADASALTDDQTEAIAQRVLALIQ